MKQPARTSQTGSFVMGTIVGLLLGLALALGVALYVTKVPIPFVNKVPQRTAEQDAAELERNKNWDPNEPLHGRPGARSASGAVGGIVLPPAGVAPGVVVPPAATVVAPAVLGTTGPGTAVAPATAAAPMVTQVKPGADPFSYFVQAGAYTRTEDAEQQRARLGMLGFEARLTEREQAGRTMYRVRVGPFERRPEAEAAREKLKSSGVDAALVTVQK
jgi:cell division protein FtsN